MANEKLSDEVWKPIVGYEGLYEVSSLGRIKSLDRVVGGGSGPRLFPGRIRKTPIANNGYRVVSLSKLGSVKVECVHVLVLKTFLGKPKIGEEGCHRDGDRENNASSNLRWDTRKGNLHDCIAHGTRRFGEMCSQAKLTTVGVADIKRRISLGEGTTAIAVDYGVAVETIHSIKTGKSWSHIHA